MWRQVDVDASLTSSWLLQDWYDNPEFKSKLLLLLFRLAQALRSIDNVVGFVAGVFVTVPYKLLSEILGVELPVSTRVGRALQIRHGFGLVVNPHAVIGSRVRLRHGTTIGNRKGPYDCPVIEDGCDIGAGSILLGRIVLGEGCRVGAGSVVLTSVPSGASVAGNPARLLNS
ncbi:serine acetyltransferase [Geodermatophilus sp. URMC 65]